MTTQPHAPFENYPPTAEDAAFAVLDSEPVDQRSRSVPVSARVGTQPSSRRGLLKMLGLGAGAVLLIGLGAWVVNRQGEAGEERDAGEGWTGDDAPGVPAPDPGTIGVGDYSATVPPGWIPISERGDEATVAKAGSTVLVVEVLLADADRTTVSEADAIVGELSRSF